MSSIISYIPAVAPSSVDFLTGNNGGAVGADIGNNISVVGSGSVTVTGDPAGNTLTISAIPYLSWSVVTGASQAMVPGNGYFANRAGTVTFTLPALAAVGDTFKVAQMHTGQVWVINYNVGQTIYIDTTNTTISTGNLTSTADGDSVEIVCRVANTDYQVIFSTGTITPN